jgi:hypothetical protein
MQKHMYGFSIQMSRQGSIISLVEDVLGLTIKRASVQARQSINTINSVEMELLVLTVPLWYC